MSKNVFDYILMGLRSKKTIEDKKNEAQLKRESEANAFEKAFTDKTYTVAKKVLDNVEKVADYDYDALFDRVNKAIDNKLPKSTKSVSSKEREYRSKEFDKKVSTHNERFSIDDYLSKQSNYKNSILEKTKKNIQKKFTEAELKNKSIKPSSQTDDPNFNVQLEVKLDSGTSDENLNVVKPVITEPFIAQEPSLNNKLPVMNEIETDSINEEVTIDIDDSIDFDKDNIQKSKKTRQPHKSDSDIESPNDLNETIDVSDKTVSNDTKKNVVNIVDGTLIQTSETLDNSIIQLDKKIVVSKDVLKSTIDSVVLKPKPLKEENLELEKPSLIDVCCDSNEEKIQLSVEVDDKQQLKTTKDDADDIEIDATARSEKIDTEYSKEDQIRQNKYYKNKKRDKFAKRMKVELEDSLIGQKKRSFKRLFKFSLSFKLSFVFMLLIVLTVVSLSVAFYLGIDYVIKLKELGKLDDIQFFKDVLIVLLIIFDMAAVLICISLGTKASRELVRPIDEMTQIVNQISVKDMNRRLNVKGMHDELKELAMTFNEMLDRIEHSYETQNRFTSDASHELRTPIAVIQGYINMLDRWGKADGEILDESIEAIKSESHNMKRLTEKLLLLAKADKGILEMDFQHFELNELINEISRETQMIDTQHEISNEINEVKTIMADRESLKQAIRIFVDNSIKYTPEGGKVSINSYINKNKIYIEIADNGIGISKEDMANIFNRFYRVDKSRTKDSGGHGLGLSIAKWIISQHKGEIEIKSEINKGTVVTLVLSPIKE